jgi:hypothetical protein
VDWAGLSTLLIAVDCLLLLTAVDVVVSLALLVTVDCVFLFVDGAVDAAVLPAAD